MINRKELYEKRNNKDVWDGFPDALKNLILTMFCSLGEYGVSDAIRYLKEHKVSMSEHSGAAKLSYLKMCARVFKNMYPMFTFEEAWTENAELIEDILTCAEGYIRDLAADGDAISYMNRDELGLYDDTDLVNIAQDLDVFFCTLYCYKEEQDKFEAKLADIFEAAKRNLSYLLQHDFAAEYKDLYDMDDFLPMDFFYWDKIGCIYHCGGAVVFPQHLIEIYEEYTDFLYELETGGNWKTRNELVIKAEKDLQFLYELDIDRIKDEIPDDEYAELAEQCEQKIRESKERVEAIRKEYAARPIGHDTDSDDTGSSERDWESIWFKARNALSEESATLSYNTWIMPLEYYRVDRNKVMYLLWPHKEVLIRHLEEYYLEQIEMAVKDIEPEIEGVKILPDETNAHKMHYHRRWKFFSNQLRDSMDAHPTMPVVVFRETGDDEKDPYIADAGLTECTVGYAKDPATGEVEKIIAVYVNKPKSKDAEDRFISEEDVPF